MGGAFRCPDCVAYLATGAARSAARTDNQAVVADALLDWNHTTDARRERGLLLAQLGDLDGAIAQFDGLEGADLEQNVARSISSVYLQRAVVRATAGDLAAAEADIVAGFHFDPSNAAEPIVSGLVSEWRLLETASAGRASDVLSEWMTALAQRPTDVALIHHAAITSVQLAVAETASERVADFWRLAFACWAAVLASPAFWDLLKARTGRVVSADDLIATRESQDEAMRQRVRDAGSTSREDGDPTATTDYDALEAAWGLELRVALLVSHFMVEASAPVPGSLPRGFACGPLMLDLMGRSEQGRELVAGFRNELTNAAGSAASHLKKYLSPMGAYHHLLDEGRLDLAIDGLEKVATWPEAQTLLAAALVSKAQAFHDAHAWEDELSYLERAATQGADLSAEASRIADVAEAWTREILTDDDPDNDREVLTILERGLRLAPSSIGLRANLAATYVRFGRHANNNKHFDEAVTLGRDALKYAPSDRDTLHAVHIICANAAFALVESTEPAVLARAVDLAKEALRYEETAEARELLAGLLVVRANAAALTKDRPHAIAFMVEALAADPEPQAPATERMARERLGALLFNRAGELRDQNNDKGALSLLLEASFYVPGHKFIGLFLADTQLRLGQPEEAASNSRQVRKAHPNDAEVVGQCGIVIANCAADLISKGQLDRAIRVVREALVEFEHSEMRQALILALSKAGRHEEAIAAGRDGMARHPGEAEWRKVLSMSLHNYAVALTERGSYDPALRHFQESLALNGNEATRKHMAQCYVMRAVTKAKAGDRWGARQDLEEAARLDPSDSTLRDLLRQIS